MLKYAIIMSGLNHSGKSYLAKKIKEVYDQFCILGTDPIHELARKEFPDLYNRSKVKNDLGSPTQIFDPALSNLKHYYLRSMVAFCINNGFSPILENCNSKRNQRVRYKEYLQTFGLKTILIFVNPGIKTIKERMYMGCIEHKNEELYSKGFDGNLERHQSIYEVPTPDEADYFIEINDDTNALLSTIHTIINAQNS